MPTYNLVAGAIGLMLCITTVIGCSAVKPDVPGEYNFISRPGATWGSPLLRDYSIFVGRELRTIYPEWLNDRNLDELFDGVESVAFRDNSTRHSLEFEDYDQDLNDGQRFLGDQGSYKMNYRPIRSDGIEFAHQLRETRHGWEISGLYDELAVKHLDAMYEYLVKGIENGQWVLDPGLDLWLHEDSRPGVYLHPWHDIAQLCRLFIRLKPDKNNPYDEFEPHFDHYPGQLDIDVYYRHVPNPENEDLDLKIPHVFIFGNRTVTHIFELDPEWGKKFHDTAAKLHERLYVLYDELKQEPDEEQQSGSEDESDDD